MDYRTLPHGGEPISVIGLGTSSIQASSEKEIQDGQQYASYNPCPGRDGSYGAGYKTDRRSQREIFHKTAGNTGGCDRVYRGNDQWTEGDQGILP